MDGWSLRIIAEPVNGAALVFHENGQLPDVLHLSSLLVVFVDLLWEEIHAVAFREPFRQPRLELSGTERDGGGVADIERHHAVVEDARVALRDELELASLRFDNR